MLCTSGFMGDVTFGRSGSYGASRVATPERSLMSMNALFLKLNKIISAAEGVLTIFPELFQRQ